MRETLIGFFLAIALIIGISLSPASCNRAVGSPVTKQIDTVLVVRHDTLVKIDSVLKYKIRRIEVAPDTEIVKQFDNVFADTGHSDTVKTTVYAERECLKCVDSLQACKKIIAIDSVAIDTLAKIAKNKEAPPTLIDDAKKVGLGVLIGITIRSFF